MYVIKYKYVGNIYSYEFDNEIKEIAEKVFKGEKVFCSSEQAMIEDRISSNNWDIFRKYYPDTTSFSFEFGVNPTLIRWFNYVDRLEFSPKETKVVWEEFCKHPEIKEISNQIWNELEMLVKNEEGWYIIKKDVKVNPFDISKRPHLK